MISKGKLELWFESLRLTGICSQRLKWINDLDRLIETNDDLNKMMKTIRSESDAKSYKVAKKSGLANGSNNAMEWQ